jgi:hypothetical protein
MCLTGIQTLCAGGGDFTTVGMCAACGNDGSSYDTSQCQEAIYDLLVGPYLGQCGWYEETPDFTTCKVRSSFRRKVVRPLRFPF